MLSSTPSLRPKCQQNAQSAPEKKSGSSPFDDPQALLNKGVCSPDLLFLLDTTKSMKPYLEDVKEEFESLVHDIRAAFNQAQVRVAIVGYKDHSDTPNIEFLDFTLSTDRMCSFLKNLDANGGDDAPEDVLGGIRQAIMATWKQETRWIIHVADAPPHSRTLHDFYDFCDHYFEPGSEPHGLAWESLLKQMIRLDINYALIRINDFTDRMVFEFSKAYNAVSAQVQLFEHNRFYRQACSMPKGWRRSFWDEESFKRRAKVTLQFKEVLPKGGVYAFKHSVLNTVAPSALRVEEEEDGTKTDLEKMLTQWGNRAWFDETIIAEGFSTEITNVDALEEMMAHDENIKISLISLTVYKRSRPFAQGARRRVFHARTEASTNGFVIKSIKQSGYQLAHFFEDMRCRSLCKAFALLFNAMVNFLFTIGFLDFVVATCVRSEKGEYLSLEPFIEGNFVEYNNNRGFVNGNLAEQSNQLAQGFSHFTFERSRGQFLVSNLHGVGPVLTNPSIHTRDPRRFQLRGMNLGEDGFKFFFSTHKCNGFCRMLQLKNRAQDIILGTCEFSRRWPSLPAVCCSNILCRKAMYARVAQRAEGFPGYQWCKRCLDQLSSSVVTSVCQEVGCYHEYEVSRFFYESQGQKLPQKCLKHRYKLATSHKITAQLENHHRQ